MKPTAPDNDRTAPRHESCAAKRTKKSRASGPRVPPASREAKRIAASVLEVLAGDSSPTAAAAALEVSLPRYYLLEQRAIEALVTACEPRTGRPLNRLLLRHRRLCRKRNRLRLHQLQWHRPGSVWAIDFTQPPAPIDGLYSSILVVRDLASGYQLLALPTTDQTAKTACDALLPLFRKFGPPILLKSDNGCFRAHEMRRFLQQWNVCPLLSPPRTPQYNGAVEAGIGSINTRTHHIAAQHGRPGEWTCDDVEAARLLARSHMRAWEQST